MLLVLVLVLLVLVLLVLVLFVSVLLVLLDCFLRAPATNRGRPTAGVAGVDKGLFGRDDDEEDEGMEGVGVGRYSFRMIVRRACCCSSSRLITEMASEKFIIS